MGWLGWLLMRRRQVETSSDLGRPPDPTFCMYLSPVDTSINWPPARPSVVVKPGTCIMRRQRPISAARPEPDFLHVSWLGWLLISPTSRNMVRSRPAARPDFLHVSVARRHIDKPAARPSMQSPPAPPPDYGCFRTYASSTSRNMVRSRPPDPNPTCRRRIRTEATIVGRWCGRTLHVSVARKKKRGERRRGILFHFSQE